MHANRYSGFVLLAAVIAAPAPAQKLRRALAAADALIVGEQAEAIPRGDQLVLHRIRVVRALRGKVAAGDLVTVVDYPKLSYHQRPGSGRRLYCLHDHSAAARRMGLPENGGPYFKMSGFPGSNPAVGADPDRDPVVELAETLARSEAGAKPAEIAAALYRIAVQGDPAVREEAVRLLAERDVLRGELTAVQWSNLVSKATGVLDDVPYKIALAELCAVQKVDGLVDALVVSLGPVTDAEYARAVGRIARHLLGEGAIRPFEARLSGTLRQKERAALLLALGATRTDSALQALLRLHALAPKDAAVEAALAEHGAPRAVEALHKDKK